MEEGSYHKFKHSSLKTKDLKAKLLATEDRELVETSLVDRIWGWRRMQRGIEKWGVEFTG